MRGLLAGLVGVSAAAGVIMLALSRYGSKVRFVAKVLSLVLACLSLLLLPQVDAGTTWLDLSVEFCQKHLVGNSSGESQ